MRSDVFGCNRMHFGALGSVPTLLEIFGFFRTILVIFGLGGLTFIDVLRLGGLFLLGLTIGRSHYDGIKFVFERNGTKRTK